MKAPILFFFAVCIFLSSCSDSAGPVLAPETIFEDQDLHVITSFFNKRLGTMSILYGNVPALAAARDHAQRPMSGELFKLVTWDLKANPYWFGSNINGRQQTVETVLVRPSENAGVRIDYEIKEAGQQIAAVNNSVQRERIKFIFAQKASVFP